MNDEAAMAVVSTTRNSQQQSAPAHNPHTRHGETLDICLDSWMDTATAALDMDAPATRTRTRVLGAAHYCMVLSFNCYLLTDALSV
jgi:hypothetical protein